MAEASPPELNEAVPLPSASTLPVEVESPVTWVAPLASVEIPAVEVLDDWDEASPAPIEEAREPELESAFSDVPGSD